jgi:hypothetical protein
MASSRFAQVAAEISKTLSVVKIAATDRDSEWQRVNSYIADVLKDSHVLYAKLARLQSDFTGHELNELEKISEDVLSIGEALSHFSKAFYEGKLQMAESNVVYGEQTPKEAPKESPSPESYDIPVEVEEEEEGGGEEYEAPEEEEEEPEEAA